MQGTIFQSAQRVIAQLLEWLQLSTNSSTAERVEDVFQNGVCLNELNGMAIVGKDVDPTLTDFFHVEVQTGIAYINGERVALLDSPLITYNASNPSETTFDGVSMNVPTPQSTGSYNIPLTTGSINYLFIAYLATIDTTVFTLNDATLAKQFYKQDDGYQIVVNTTGINPNAALYILLGQVDLTGSNQAVTSNISIVNRPSYKTLLNRVGIQTNNGGKTDRPASYSIGSNNYFLDDHIKSVGTGTVSPINAHGLSLVDLGVNVNDTVGFHREYEHVRGIIAGTAINPYPTSSAFYVQRIQVTPGDDYIIVQALGPNEVAVLNGVAYTATQFGANVTITFSGNPTAVYNVYFDGTTFGITTASIVDDTTKLWLATTTWTATPGDGNLSIPYDRRQLGTLNLLERWVTAGRPQDPISGNFGYNLDSNSLEYYNGTTWQQPISNLNFSLTNILDNGGFEIWQRGTTFTNPTNGQYTADRWTISSNGIPSYIISQNNSIVDSGLYSCEINVTNSNSTTYWQFLQKVENYSEYRGKTVTFSMAVWSNVPGSFLELADGISYAVSSAHPGDGQYHTLSVTLNVSMSSNQLLTLFSCNGSSQPAVGTYYLDSAMLVEGSVPVSYIPLHPEEDLSRCQRYFQNGIISGIVPFLGGATLDSASVCIRFGPTMRVAPTVSIPVANITIGMLPNVGTSSTSVPATLSANLVTPSEFSFAATIAHQTTYQIYLIYSAWTASADL